MGLWGSKEFWTSSLEEEEEEEEEEEMGKLPLAPGTPTKERPCEASARRQLSTSEEEGLTRHQSCLHLGLGLPVSRIVRNKFLLFKPPNGWHSVTATRAN